METNRKAEVPVRARREGKFLEVLKRQPDGSWSYVVDMYSSNCPIPK